MQSQTDSIIRTGEPTIALPTNVQPSIPPQYWGTEGTILAIAILIRSIALLIHVLKSGPKK
ncbi:hypothetical protein [Microcoleus sp. B9-D4]|jgi:hypothetical protein|uniref:hypothetical protein n=1 Tax=Microcoleus sp. B9-D4 TaxID=2818711 RepID=UPI002FD4CD7E